MQAPSVSNSARLSNTRRLFQRTIRLVGLWLSCLAGEFAVFIVAAAAAAFVSDYGYASASFFVALIVGNVVLIGSIFRFRYKRRHKWLREEADRWLAHRSRFLSGAYRRRSRLIRKGLWLPSLLALTILLFPLESFGILTHLFYPRAVVNGYHVAVPITWWVVDENPHDLVALAGKGIGRIGPMPYWQLEFPVSDMGFYAIEDPAQDRFFDGLPAPEIAPTRTLKFGNGELMCWESGRLKVPSVRCVSSKNDLAAFFDGDDRADLDAFYQVVERVTESK